MSISPQERVYRELISLVAEIATEGFGIDVLHNPTYAAVFEAQLHKFHPRIVRFIELIVPQSYEPASDVQGTVDKLATSFSAQKSEQGE